MRLIVVGCENVGKTTLANNIHSWGQENGFPFHLDDHFTIPDTQNLNEDELRDLSQRRKPDWESGEQPTELGTALGRLPGTEESHAGFLTPGSGPRLPRK